MAGRASYRRAQDRVDDFKWWDDEYNAKFDALTYYWPVVGDVRRAFDEINDIKRYAAYHNISWTDMRSGRLAAQLPRTGSSIAYVSKNLMRLYR